MENKQARPLWLHRLLTGLRILSRFLLLLPIPVFMVWFSYNVDRSGLFQGDLAPREAANLLLEGKDVTNFEQMDERQVVRLYIQNLTEETTPEVIGLGSSRVLQFTQNIIGSGRFFNLGVTGADIRDVMTTFYLMDKEGRLPKTVVWSVDPWVLYGGENSLDSRADAELYQEFLQEILHIDTGYQEPDKVELWKALAEPAYFQGNVDYYLQNRNGQALDDSGNAIPFQEVTGDPYNQPTAIKRGDGSILYSASYRGRDAAEVSADAMLQLGTFDSLHMEGFTQLDEAQCKAVMAFIQYLRSRDVNVILVLSPFYPTLYQELFNQYTYEGQHSGFFQVERWLRSYAASEDIPLIGSYDPCTRIDLEASLANWDKLAGEAGTSTQEFLRADQYAETRQQATVYLNPWPDYNAYYDGVHCTGELLHAFFPSVDRILQLASNDLLPDPTEILVRTVENANG